MELGEKERHKIPASGTTEVASLTVYTREKTDEGTSRTVLHHAVGQPQ